MVAQIWEDIVELDYVIPDDGTCINIVMTAARHADPLLCANALRILVARGVQSEFLASCMASAYENRQNLESRNATSEIVEEDRKELQPGGSMIPEERLRSWGADWE
jgi:hypothetical protein